MNTDRDGAIAAMLPLVPSLGWTTRCVRQAAGPDADLLFPGGAADMVEAYIDRADRRMVEGAASVMAEQRLSKRIRTLILERLRQAQGEKAAVRRAFAVLALPGNAGIAARTATQTVSRIWQAAGDTSADFSWYTKRAILAAAYGATLLYWMRDETTEQETEAFLDRRLAGIAAIGRLKARFSPARPAKP